MKPSLISTLGLPALFCLELTNTCHASSLKYHYGGVMTKVNFEASVQYGEFNNTLSSNDINGKTHIDASGRLTSEFTTQSGWLVGLRLEYDTGDHAAEELQRDEVYGYVANQYGRVEFGEQDGPADSLAYHAPIIGLGQIRGEFARYSGSQARLSPYDSGDALKLIYLSAPNNGLRYGISWAPRFERHIEEPLPRDRTIQDDAVEFGIQYKQPLNNWIAGLSASYVTANALPSTEKEDIESWSVGTQWRRNHFIFGAAYVDRGNSNRRKTGFRQHEINGGITWQHYDYGFSFSTAKTKATSQTNTLMGLGMYYEIVGGIYLSVDVVHNRKYRETSNEENYVFVTEIKFKI